MTASMSIALSTFSGSAKLTVSNTHATLAYYITLLKIRGDALVKEPAPVKAEDSTSQTAYGIRELRVNVPWQQGINIAQDLADAWCQFYKDPNKSCRVTMEANYPTSIERELGDKITFTAALYDISAELYRLGKIQIESMDENLEGLRVTWWLEPADDQQWWKLGDAGFSELGDTTRLGY
jgi:hypothetical protein